MTKEDERFQNSSQEKVKLTIALKRYFEVSEDDPFKKIYGDYLQYRIWPAMEMLIEKEDLKKLQVVWEQNWITKDQLERGLQYAREMGKLQAHVWLMQRKTERFSFAGKDFSL
ncbi:MAG: hypothetical protein ACOYBL_02995 [Lachnospiraceae bacterium]|jgi:hypothetical protein